MDEKQKIRRCFIIGPMQDMKRLYRLRDEIIRPLLPDYEIKTPDEGEIGSIMRQVLLNLEQADILVADLTGNNPNVMYELGIYHSFGKPYLALKEKGITSEVEKTPFDIADYRFVEIDFEDIEESKKAISKNLTPTLNQIDTKDWFENPVTNFYRSPVAEIPTAIGLAKNYRRNFLDQIIPDIFQKSEENKDNYLVKVLYQSGVDKKKQPKFTELSNEERKNLKIELLIPEKMDFIEHSYIKSLKDSHDGFEYINAKIIKTSREFTTHIRKDNNGNWILADFPTILSTLLDSITRRRDVHQTGINENDWETLEAQELERFANKCELFKKETEKKHYHIKNRISIVWRWNPE